MENLSLEVAYARYGADVSSRHRNLSSIAEDGSLVLTCPSDRFTRPGIGVLRYHAQISAETGSAAYIVALRSHVQSAFGANTEVKPVVITPARGSVPKVIHVRADLIGHVVEFDGDKFVVDFTRIEAEPVVKPRRNKR